MKYRLLQLTSLTILLLFFIMASLNAQESLKPSEGLKKAEKLAKEKYTQYLQAKKDDPDLEFNYKEAFASFVSELLPTVQKKGLNPEEQFSLTKLYTTAKHFDKARALYDTLAAGNGETAEQASGLRLMLILQQKKYEEVAPLIAEHQRRFPYIGDKENDSFVYTLGTYVLHLAKEGKHEAAVNLILKEIGRLPDPPRSAYKVPIYVVRLLPSFVELGRKEEALKIVDHYLAAYRALYEKKSANLPEGNSEEAKKAKRQTTQIEQTMLGLQKWLTQATLVGEEAPAIKFSRVYNAAEDLTFADLKGKVVLLDFWSNWCSPCKAAFPKLGKLYAEYREKGLVILSVTGLQGRFFDGDIRLQSVKPEEEIRLTEELIKRYEVSWPVVFSDRGPFDPEYGVLGIPTTVILDRNGTVREIMLGFRPGDVEALRKTIEKLLKNN